MLRARSVFTGLLMLEVAALLFLPVVLAWPLLGRVVHLLLVVTLVAAVSYLSQSRGLLWLSVGLGIATEVLRTLAPTGDQVMILTSYGLDAALTGLAMGFIAYSTWTEREVRLETIFGAIAGYLLLGLIWALLYGLLELSTPGAIRLGEDLRFPGSGVVAADQLDAKLIYFSFVTLTTLGYGDVTPASAGAATLAMLQAVTGQLYIAVLIARLVAIASTPSASK
jgi:hypothetical protein